MTNVVEVPLVLTVVTALLTLVSVPDALGLASPVFCL
jgi:hypothetical protein